MRDLLLFAPDACVCRGDMGTDGTRRAIGITSSDGFQHRGMFIPDIARHFTVLQHFTHGPPQVLPVGLHRLNHEWIPAGLVDPLVKVHVCQKCGVRVACSCNLPAELNDSLAGGDLPLRRAYCSQRSRQRLQGRAQLEDRVKAGAVDGRHLEPTSSAVYQEALHFELTQRSQHRLARHLQLLREFILPHRVSWRQNPLADRVQDLLVDLFDERLGALKGFDAHGPCIIAAI